MHLSMQAAYWRYSEPVAIYFILNDRSKTSNRHFNSTAKASMDIGSSKLLRSLASNLKKTLNCSVVGRFSCF